MKQQKGIIFKLYINLLKHNLEKKLANLQYKEIMYG